LGIDSPSSISDATAVQISGITELRKREGGGK